MLRITVKSLFFLYFLSLPAWGYYVENGRVYNDNGREVRLYGVNWFGFETGTHVAHGLWIRTWQDMIRQIKSLGFTAVRLPFCPDTLKNVPTTSINYFVNPDLQDLGSLDILDKVVREFNRQGIYILLDHHSPDCQTLSELWYTGGYSEQDWIGDLVFLAERYENLTYFLGIDLKNEPHGSATWGTGNVRTDWNLAAERAAAEVLLANPNLLIFVEGIQGNPSCSSAISHWWGGNLEPVECYPLDIPEDKLVLSPHVYGPDVFVMSYFDDPDFPANMPDIWTTHFGYLVNQGYTVIVGEFGGKYGQGDPRDRTLQNRLVNYMSKRGIRNFFYWSWNANSGDTGGILASNDDWTAVRQDKVRLLNRLKADCFDRADNDDDGLTDYPEDPGCANANDSSESNAP